MEPCLIKYRILDILTAQYKVMRTSRINIAASWLRLARV